MAVVRFGVSLEKELLESLDKIINENQFSNRSQAIRFLIKSNIVKSKWESNSIVAGSITLVFQHHKSDLLQSITDIQHQYHEEILSSQHFHLDHDNCLEVIAVRGKAKRLNELADKLKGVKGINHGGITMSQSG